MRFDGDPCKRVLDFDDVMNMQREVVYGYRNEVLTTEVPRDLVNEIIDETIPAKVHEYLADRDQSEPDYNELMHWVNATLPVSVTPDDFLGSQNEAAISAMLVAKVKQAYGVRVGDLPMEVLDQEERRMVLAAIDKQWQAHLYNMDALREGVGLRAQGQKDPLVEFKQLVWFTRTDGVNAVLYTQALLKGDGGEAHEIIQDRRRRN